MISPSTPTLCSFIQVRKKLSGEKLHGCNHTHTVTHTHTHARARAHTHTHIHTHAQKHRDKHREGKDTHTRARAHTHTEGEAGRHAGRHRSFVDVAGQFQLLEELCTFGLLATIRSSPRL